MDKERFFSSIVFNAFETPVEFLAVLARKLDMYPLFGDELENAHLGFKRVYRFIFAGDSDPKDRSLFIGHGRNSDGNSAATLTVAGGKSTSTDILSFARHVELLEFEEYDDPPLAIMDVTQLIQPLDSMFEIPIQAKRVAVVNTPAGETWGFFVWFTHGSSIGFLYSHYDELVVLYGADVDRAYAQALTLGQVGKMRVLHRAYATTSSKYDGYVSQFQWFP